MKFTLNPQWVIQNSLTTNNYSKIFVLSDSNTQKHCLPLIADFLPKHQTIYLNVSQGEVTKNIDTCIFLWQELNKMGADRHSLLINLGGGMITDLGSFIASTYKRGIDFINIPTSMLAMIDASIGGKNGINLGEFKNQVGTINNATDVIIAPVFLETIDRRNYLSGFAEAMKHALLSGNRSFVNTLNHIDPLLNSDSFINFLKENIAVKQNFAAADPYEKTGRKALNLGHTIGHALESLLQNSNTPLLHGEAVAWGLLAELHISVQKLAFPKAYLTKIAHIVGGHYPALTFSEASYKDLMTIMQQDKKNYGGEIRFTLLSEPGVWQLNQTAGKNEIMRALEFIDSV